MAFISSSIQGYEGVSQANYDAFQPCLIFLDNRCYIEIPHISKPWSDFLDKHARLPATLRWSTSSIKLPIRRLVVRRRRSWLAVAIFKYNSSTNDPSSVYLLSDLCLDLCHKTISQDTRLIVLHKSDYSSTLTQLHHRHRSNQQTIFMISCYILNVIRFAKVCFYESIYEIKKTST